MQFSRFLRFWRVQKLVTYLTLYQSPRGTRRATSCTAEKFGALRPRQTKRAHTARRAAVSPPKMNDCEDGWVCFNRESMTVKEGAAARAGAGSLGLR